MSLDADNTPSAPPGEEWPAIELTAAQKSFVERRGRLYEMPLESFAVVERFETADELLNRLHSYPLRGHEWAFRGQANIDWTLEPSIERLANSYPQNFRSGAEKYVQKAFRRRAHHYVQCPPDESDELEWMALMRHHGAPTRLLDWTRSPYVAAFFALADAKENDVSTIWAIDVNAVKAEALELLIESGTIGRPQDGDFSLSDPQLFKRIFLEGTSPALVAPVQPRKMNERMTSQQGLFLCANRSMFGFEFGLKNVLMSYRSRWEESAGAEVPPRPLLFKLNLAGNVRSEMLQELYRMNVSYSTLLPGLDGFARSLGTNITITESPYQFFGEELDSTV